jgi:HD-GYP domain-containing protein (c-di-GMP phosphodiesterase class II)
MRYVTLDRVKPGMSVGKSIYDESGRVLVNYRVKLSEHLIARMKQLGLPGLYIEDALSQDITIEELISDELQIKASKALQKMDIDAALTAADTITNELSMNGEISMNLVSLRTNSDYTYKHSVNVAVLSVITGIGLGMKKGLLSELAAAGLLHDIGKVNIPHVILDKPGPLTEEEYAVVKNHSEFGYEKIKDNILISSKTKMGVYSHHENINGTGYPLGLCGDQIYMFAKIIHIADVYDALISQRTYKRAHSPAEAIDFIKNNAGTMFEPEYVEAFLTYIPLYPKGRNIILNDGQVAIVVENRQHHTLRPIVRLLDGTTIDLSEPENIGLDIIGFECFQNADKNQDLRGE